MINYCTDTTCLNRGVCRPVLLNYTCECLGDSYLGRHCEIIARKTIVSQTVSRSFAFVAIVALGTVGMFVLALDVLNYGFGIDPAGEELQRASTRTRQRRRTKSIVAIRFLYVNAQAAQVENSILF